MKILLIHSTAGAGHFKAAQAVYNGLQKRGGHACVIIDALDYTSPAFKKLYRQTYFTFISRIPRIWGFFFGLLDQPLIQPCVRGVRRIYNSVNAGKLVRFLEEEKFDVIVSTHFLSTEVCAALKREGKIQPRLITVVTDFDVHKIWLADGVDTYAVALPWTKEKLKRIGVREDRIVITGIPTDEKFSQHPDIGVLKKKIGIRDDVFTVLMATGSFGIGPIEEIIDALQGTQLLVVCGHNKDLFARLSAKAPALVKVLGLVDNMDELMAVSDCMITKPGGLSIAEALVKQLPLIFFNAIPGQETNNIKVLSTYGIGVETKNINAIVSAVKEFQSSRDLFMAAVKKNQVAARPNAVRDIIDLINNN